MNRLDRYIGAAVGGAFLVALGALLAIFSVINLTQELRDVGDQYTLPTALWFVVLTLPAEAYELFAAAALVGSVAGLALLATHNELTAIFAAGVSTLRVVGAVLQTAIVLALAAALLGEWVAAPLAERAISLRSIALSGGQSLGTARGIWAREGSRYLNIRHPNADGTLEDVYFYDFDERFELERVTHAEHARYVGGEWQLRNLSEDLILESGVVRKNLSEQIWNTNLTPEQLHLLMLPPEQLSIGDLDQSVRSMQRRGESAQHYQLAYWRRVTMPVVAAMMVFLAVPVVLTMPQRVPFGYRVALGALLGVGFQMINQTFGSFGTVYGVSPFLGATLPAIAAFLAGLWGLRRTLVAG